MHSQSILIIELLNFFGALKQFWCMRSSTTLIVVNATILSPPPNDRLILLQGLCPTSKLNHYCNDIERRFANPLQNLFGDIEQFNSCDPRFTYNNYFIHKMLYGVNTHCSSQTIHLLLLLFVSLYVAINPFYLVRSIV